MNKGMNKGNQKLCSKPLKEFTLILTIEARGACFTVFLTLSVLVAARNAGCLSYTALK